MEKLEKRLKEAERFFEIARKEQFILQTCKIKEAHDKLQVQRKLEKVQKKLDESWLEIHKNFLDLLEASDVGEPEK